MSLRKSILKVTPDALLGLLKSGTRRVDKNPLPDDARAVHASVDASGNIVIVVESLSFPAVKGLDPTPMLDAPCFRRLTPKRPLIVR